MNFMFSMLFAQIGRRLLQAPLVQAVVAGACALALAGCGGEPVNASTPNQAGTGKAPAGAAALAASGLQSNAVVKIKSTFHKDPNFGRDPFFPGSRKQVAKATAVSMPQLPSVSYMKLVGIRSGTTRPMALINRTPIAQGEERDVTIVVTNQFNKVEVQKVSVRCLEIGSDSVLISIGGEPGVRELRMAQPK